MAKDNSLYVLTHAVDITTITCQNKWGEKKQMPLATHSRKWLHKSLICGVSQLKMCDYSGEILKV
jgi:hypothetical protein